VALKDYIKDYGISFKKTLGQNLLLDDNINRIMTDAAALTHEDSVIEVGAGLGALTSRIYPKVEKLLSVEIDRSFMPCLEDQFQDVHNIALFRGDILNHSLTKLVDEYMPNHRRLKMVSNLPYYITTPILFHFWESGLYFERMVVMVQEEVGHRMVAPIGEANYGKFTLSCNLKAEVDIVHKVPASCFRPKPKVDSCIVRFRNRSTPLFEGMDEALFEQVVGVAFSQRRKTIRNTLVKSGALPASNDDMLQILEESSIDPSRRPQTLSIHEFSEVTFGIQRYMDSIN
jgi:16S rRNA (adenine1518-N6/adenine1519-N6)-dimethyltransferase